MPTRIIKQPNGKFTAFSSIVDYPLIYEATDHDVIKWLTTEYHQQHTLKEAEWKLDNGKRDLIPCTKKEGDGRNRWDDDMFHALIVHWRDEDQREELFRMMSECGMSDDEIVRWRQLAMRATHDLDTTDGTAIHARYEK